MGRRIVIAVAGACLLAACPPGPPVIGDDLSCSNDCLELHHLDVGQGDATLIRGPDGTTVLIDAGKNDKGREVVVPYLESHGIDALDVIIATHVDADHLGGIDEVIQGGIDVERVLDNGDVGDTPTYRDYEDAADATGGSHAFEPGDEIELGDGAVLECMVVFGHIVGGDEIEVETDNDRGMGFVLRYGEFAYFVGGDLGGGGLDQADVEGAIADVVGRVDVLRVNHHGSRSSTNARFVAATRPDLAIISTGGNDYGHPTQEVIDRLLDADVELLLTEEGDGGTGGRVAGHIVVRSDGAKWEVETQH